MERRNEEGAHRQRKLAHARHGPQTATVTPEQVCGTPHCSFPEDLTSALGTPPYAFLKQTRTLSGLHRQQGTEKIPNAKPEDKRTWIHRRQTAPNQPDAKQSDFQDMNTSDWFEEHHHVCQTPGDFLTRAFRMVSWLIWQ